MLKIMLCGARDTEPIVDDFNKVVEGIGGEPHNYLRNSIEYGSQRPSWVDNSIETVRDMDICVFVLISKVGKITWNSELIEACNSDKTFIVICESSLHKHLLQGKKPVMYAVQHELFKKLNNVELTSIPFSLEAEENSDDSFSRVLRSQLEYTIHRVFRKSLNKYSIAENYLLPSIAYGVLSYLHTDDKHEEHARFVVAKYEGEIRKTIAAYGGSNRIRKGKEKKDFGVIGIMNEKCTTVFYDFVNETLWVWENDKLTKGMTRRSPGKGETRRAMLAVPIWQYSSIIGGALTFDFFRESSNKDKDIINNINRDPNVLEVLMRNSQNYAAKVKELLF